jgi:hypothetical protein
MGVLLTSEAIADYALELSWDDLPTGTLDAADRLVLDRWATVSAPTPASRASSSGE